MKTQLTRHNVAIYIFYFIDLYNHAYFAALPLNLGEYYRQLQSQTKFSSAYDRIDLPLASMEVRSRLLKQLQTQPLTEIAGKAVIDCQTIDGYKFRLEEDKSWLMIRFSGTEPVLRLYCEAPTLEQVHKTLAWAKQWAE